MYTIKYIKEFVLLSITILLFKQNTLYSQNNNDSIHKYYSYVYLAEHQLLEGNIEKSISYYTNAFKFSYPRSKDLYNVFLASYYINDTIKTKSYANELIIKGYDISFFTDSITNPNLYKLIQNKSFLETPNNFICCDSIFYKFCDTIFEDDQKIRTDSNFISIQKAKDKQNFEKIKNYIAINSYPSFEKFGFCNKFSNPISICPTFELILWHNRFEIDSQFIKVLTINLLSGDIQPNEFTKITIANKDLSNSLTLKPWEIEKVCKTSSVKNINKKREYYLLDKLEDYLRKYKYHLINKFDKFIFIDPVLITNNEIIINSGFYGE